MINLQEFIITESKPKGVEFVDYDIKVYLDACINKWLENMHYTNVLTSGIDNYSKLNLCRQCEIILHIFDLFADDIDLHFYSALSEEDRQKYYAYSKENSIYNVFKVIEKLLEVEVENPKAGLADGESIEEELSDLKKRFESLVKKCNDKWIAKTKENSKVGIGCPVPCSCDCCCKCC